MIITSTRNLKWWRKLFFHFLPLLLNNAYILNKKFRNVSLNHEKYLEYIAKHLINSTISATKLPKQFKVSGQKVDAEKRLSERHFLSCIQEQPVSKCTKPVRLCFACNFSKTKCKQIIGGVENFKHIFTSYCCPDCDVPLCVETCFCIFHSKKNYEKHNHRFTLGRFIAKVLNWKWTKCERNVTVSIKLI